jgi:hypothetical protein
MRRIMSSQIIHAKPGYEYEVMLVPAARNHLLRDWALIERIKIDNCVYGNEVPGIGQFENLEEALQVACDWLGCVDGWRKVEDLSGRVIGYTANLDETLIGADLVVPCAGVRP